MFAPYCESCQSRILLGTRSIVQLICSPGGAVRALLACVCGNVVDSEARPPAKRGPAESPPRRGDQPCGDQVPVAAAS